MPRSVLRVVRRGAGFAVLFAIVLLGGLLWFLASHRGEEMLRSLVVNRLGPRLGVDISIGELETNLFTRLALNDVVITMPDSDAPPLARFSSGTVTYSLIDLLSFRLTISSVTLDSLIVQVQRDSTGGLQIPGRSAQDGDKMDKNGGSSPLTFWFGTLSLRDGTFIYDDRAVPLRARLNGLQAALSHLPVDGYRLTAGADSGHAHIAGMDVPVGAFNVDTMIRGSSIHIDKLALHAADINFSANGTVLFDESPPAVSMEVTVTGDAAALATVAGDRLPGQLRELSGPLHATGSITTDENGINVAYSLEAAPFQVGSLPFTSVSLTGLYENQMVVLDSLRIITPAGGQADISGRMALDSLLTHEVSITFDAFQMDRFWRFFRRNTGPYRGRIGGTVTSRGPLRQYRQCEAAFSGMMQGISFDGESYDNIAIDARYYNDELILALVQDGTSIDGSVSIADSLAGGFNAHVSDAGFLNGFLGVHAIGGTVTIDGRLGGKLTAPTIALSFEGENASYRDFPIDHLKGSLTYRPGSFSLFETMLDGHIDDIASLAFPPLPEGMGGGIDYEGTVSYLDGTLAADARFDLAEPSFQQFGFDRGAAIAALRDTVVSISSLEFHRNDLTIAAAGEYRLGGRTLYSHITAFDSTGRAGGATVSLDLADSTRRTGEVLVTGVNLSRMHAFADSLPPLGGVANGALRFELTPEGQALSVIAAVDSFRHKTVSVDRIMGAGVLADGTVRVDSLVVYSGGNRLTSRGRLVYGEWPENGLAGLTNARTEGRIRADSLALDTFGAYLPADTRLEGTASVDLSWDGTVADPWLSGFVRIRDGFMQAALDTPPVEQIGIGLRFDRSRVTIEQFTAASHNLTVQAWGMMMAHAIDDYEGALTVAVNGQDALSAAGRYRNGMLSGTAAGTGFNLGAMQGFVPMMRNLEGTLQAELAMSGNPEMSNLTGYISARGLAFSPPGLRERVSNGSLRVTFDHTQVSLDTLTADLGGGTITGTGSMEIEGNAPRAMNLELNGKRMNLKQTNAYDIRINDVSVNGAVADGRIVLEGDMTLGETRITRNIRTRDIIAMTRNRPERPGKPNPLLDTARLSIRLHDSEAVWIDNNLAKLRLQPELTITGSPRAPVITGRLGANEGSLFYLDRKFELTRLYLDFIDPDRINPMLDIQAETSVRSAQNPGDEPFVITLAISGSAEAPRFSLTSNPALDQADILALLTFGATRSQLAASAGQSEILQSRAELLSSQQLSNYLSREARSLLGLDDLSIQGNLFNTGKASGPQLLASDTINDRLKVTYTTTVGEQNEQSIRLDYRLSRFFSLEGQTNQDGDSGLDLKYRIKF